MLLSTLLILAANGGIAFSFSPFVDIYAKPAIGVSILPPDYDNTIILDTEAEKILSDKNNNSISEVVKIQNQSYLCTLPVLKSDDDPLNSPNEITKAVEERSTDYLFDLLSPLTGKCIKTKGPEYWTYELCFNRAVKQYHDALRKKVQPDTPIYLLGVMPGDPLESIRLEPPNDVHSGSIVQSYGNGTVCDLTNKPRTIDVHYRCLPSNYKDYFQIVAVNEVRTCHYEMVVATSVLCGDNLLTPKDDVNEVVCKRIVSRDEAAALLVQQPQEPAGNMRYSVADRLINDAYRVEELEFDDEGLNYGGNILKTNADEDKVRRFVGSATTILTEMIRHGTLQLNGMPVTTDSSFDTLIAFNDDSDEQFELLHVTYSNGLLEVALDADEHADEGLSINFITADGMILHDEL